MQSQLNNLINNPNIYAKSGAASIPISIVLSTGTDLTQTTYYYLQNPIPAKTIYLNLYISDSSINYFTYSWNNSSALVSSSISFSVGAGDTIYKTRYELAKFTHALSITRYSLNGTSSLYSASRNTFMQIYNSQILPLSELSDGIISTPINTVNNTFPFYFTIQYNSSNDVINDIYISGSVQIQYYCLCYNFT